MKYLLITFMILWCFLVNGQEAQKLSLEECINIAIENNLNVRRSQLNLANSEVSLMQAKAQRYPTLNFGGSYGYNWGRSIDPTTNQFINQRITSSNFNGRSGVTIINGMQITNSITQGKVDVEASQFDLQKSNNDIALSTAQAFLNIILNKELVENANFQLESSKQQLEQTKLLVEAGSLPISNELQLISTVATNEVNLITAQNNLDLAILTMKQTLLLEPGAELDIEIPDIIVDESSIDEMTISEIYAIAEGNQPEIKSADLNVKSARLGLKVSQGAMYPSLSANANLNTNYSDAADRPRTFFSDSETEVVTQEVGFLTNDPSQTVSQSFERGVITEVDPDFTFGEQYDENLSTSVTLNMNIPIFNGFNTRSNIQRSKITLQQAEINKVDQQNILYQNIETAYRNALAASRTHAASQRQVEALQETFRVLERQYNNGAANFTDYQVASNNLFGAQSDLTRAKYDYVFRLKILEFYQGKTLSFD